MKRFLAILLSLSLLPLAGAKQLPKVVIETTLGNIEIELYTDKAPKTVANFLMYVDEGFYTNTLFHRVIPGFMIQGGGFTPDYQRKQTKAPVINEADNGLQNKRGTIAMARTGDPHSATAQFFINNVDNGFLNHSAKTPRGWGYTVFGKVVSGMDVVDRISKEKTGPGGPFVKNAPRKPVIIKRIVRKTTTAAGTNKQGK